MGNSLVNTRDQRFVLFEQLGIDKLLESEAFKDFSRDDLLMVLNEAEKMAVNVILPTLAEGDKEGCTIKDGKVSVPKCFHDAYKKYTEAGWLAADQYNAALIFDEIQCGMGRTGRLFAFEHFGVTPDIVCIAKPMAAGFPMGAFLANDKFAQHITPASTAPPSAADRWPAVSRWNTWRLSKKRTFWSRCAA